MRFFNFEHHHHRLAPRRVFVVRMLRNFLVATAVIGASVGLGIWGYVDLEGLDFEPATHSAVRVMTGMDPPHQAATPLGKWFVIAYSLTSKFIIVVATSLFLAPALHRMLHRFHIGERDDRPDDD